jgi:oligosaccharide repeat unit polymerase
MYLLSFFIFVVSIILMHLAIGVLWFKRITIPGAFYLTYLFMIFIPAFYVYQDHPGDARDVYIIGVVSVLITVPLGIIFVNYLYNFKRAEINYYFTSSPVVKSTVNTFPAIFLVSAFTIFFTLYYFYQLPSIPIIEMIQGGGTPESLTISREQSFKLIDPRWGGTNLFYVYLFNRTLVFPVLILVTLGYYLYTKEKRWLYLFILVLSVGGFYAISQLSRAPIAAIIMRIFVFLLLFNRGHLNLKKIIIGFFLILAYPVMVTNSYVDDRTVLEAIEAVFIRMTYTPARDLYYYFEIFPTHHEYLHGETLIKPFLKLLELDYFYIENFVALYISPGGVQSAHANAAFLSNLNADFGLLGVFFGGFIIAMIMQWIQIKILRKEKNIYNMTIFAFILYAIWVLNFGSITSVLLVNGVIPIFILIFSIKVLRSILNLISTNIRV